VASIRAACESPSTARAEPASIVGWLCTVGVGATLSCMLGTKPKSNETEAARPELSWLSCANSSKPSSTWLEGNRWTRTSSLTSRS
jgi:hypothetical protein